MMSIGKRKLAWILAGTALLLLAGVLAGSLFRGYIATRLVQPPVSYSRTLKVTVPDNVYPQDYTVSLFMENEDGDRVAISEPVTITVENVSEIPDDEPQDPASNTESPDGSDEGEGGGGSSGGGGGGGGEPIKPLRRSIYYPQRGHAISGFFSGIVTEGYRFVAKLGSNTAFLVNDSVRMKQPDDYWLFISAKHDAPAPVHLAVYVNDKAWKTLLLDKGDNKYRTHRVGLLRGFRTGRIKFRLVNDTYNKAQPENENEDRNLYLEWWALSNQSNPQSLNVGGAAPAAAAPAADTQYRPRGWSLMPELNRYISEELGPQHVNFDIWKYYAWRLAAPKTNRAAISSESHLRAVMRYWKAQSPASPRGDYL